MTDFRNHFTTTIIVILFVVHPSITQQAFQVHHFALARFVSLSHFVRLVPFPAPAISLLGARR